MRTAPQRHVTGRVLAVSAAAGLVICLASCGRQTSAGGGPRLAAYLGKALGEAQAPIQIEALLPVNNGCQDALGLYLASVAAQYPALFQVRIFDMKSTEGRMLMTAKGIKCAAVIVQGTTRFDLGGAEGKVLLEGPMDPADLCRVLQHLAQISTQQSVTLPPPPDDSVTPSPDERRKAGF